MRRKLRSKKGESLVEVMAAILIVALSVTMLYTLLMSASAMNKRARTLSEQYQQELNTAEERANPTSGTVTVGTESVDVTFYAAGDDGALTAYTAEGGG